MERGDDIEGASQLSDQLERLTIHLRDWRSLPPEVQDLILAFLPLNELFKARLVCKNFRNVMKRRTFNQARARLCPTECSLSPLVFYAEKDSWHMRGFDYKNRIWRKLSPFKYLIPAPDPDLFKDFHVAGDKGLFCMNVGKASEAEKLYVCNPLTGETFKLPPLEFSRHPVIMSVHVTFAKRSGVITSCFLVIAVGSAAIGTESLSRKTDVYDSVKGEWEAAGDVPGADFSLNDYQTGVYCEGLKLLLCVGFMVNGSKGILALDVEKRKWREDWICPFYQLHPVIDTALMVYFAIAQLVECSGRIYLFSEQEDGRNVTHCIDRLDLDRGSEGFTWTRVVTRQRQGNRALLVYPEYTCVPVGENKLCIFNTIEKTGVVYDMLIDPVISESFETLPSPDLENGIMFHSLNKRIYLFSEQEDGRNVTHCIDRLDLDRGSEGFTWTRVVTRQRQGNRALLVYPEYTCVPVGENKLCIFNTIEKTGVVYDMLIDPVISESFETLPSPDLENGIMFHSLNPVGYAFEPSFGVSVPEDGGNVSSNAKESFTRI